MPIKKKVTSTKATVKKVRNKKVSLKKDTSKIIDDVKIDTGEISDDTVETYGGNKKIYYFVGIIILLGFIVFLTVLSQNKIWNNPESLTGSITPITTNDNVVKTGSTVRVDYVGKFEDGTIFDSSVEEFAKQSDNYNTGATYSPIEFVVGAGQMIKGFEQGIIGMKLGEKKTLTILPKDAYGEEIINKDIPKQYFDDVITRTIPIDNFKDTISQTVPKSMLGEKGATIKEKDEIEVGSGVKGIVTKIEGDNVTIEIQNTQNPFYGKKLVEGLKVNFEGNDITLKKLTETEVTLDINNTQNPFYGKKLVEGLVGKLSNGQEVKIIKINEDTVNIQMQNPEKLAGKTLIFDVEVKDIK